MYYTRKFIFAVTMATALGVAPRAFAVPGGDYIEGQGTLFLYQAPQTVVGGVPKPNSPFDGLGVLWGTKQGRYIAAMSRLMLSRKLGGGDFTVFLGEELELTLDFKNIELYPAVSLGLTITKTSAGPAQDLFVGGGGGVRVFIDPGNTLFAGGAAEVSLLDLFQPGSFTPTWDFRVDFGYRY